MEQDNPDAFSRRGIPPSLLDQLSVLGLLQFPTDIRQAGDSGHLHPRLLSTDAPPINKTAAERVDFHQRIALRHLNVPGRKRLPERACLLAFLLGDRQAPGVPQRVAPQFEQTPQQRIVSFPSCLRPDMNHRFQGPRGKRRRQFGHHQLLDDRSLPQAILERHEPFPLPSDKIGLFEIGLQAINNKHRFASVLAVGNPMRKHRQVRLHPTALDGRHPHVAQGHDVARPNLRLQGLAGAEVFHNLHTQESVGIVVLIGLVVGLDQPPFVQDQHGKTENAEFISGQIGQARRIGERLF